MAHESRPSAALRALRAAFPHTLPVLTGFTVLGLAYGVLMASKGYGPAWSLLMSALCFCGSMQFAAIALLTTAFDPIQALLLSLMVNARHLFYGVSMLEKYKGLGKKRLFLIFALCDETFSITSSVAPPPGTDRGWFYLWISLMDYLYWVIASVLGGVLGGVLPFDTTGLDFALTALFVVLFIEQLRRRENLAPGILGLACTGAALVAAGPDNLVIPAMILTLGSLLLGRRRLES